MASEEFDVQDYAASMQEIGKRFDSIDRALVFQGQQVTEVSRKLDDQELSLYEQGAILRQHSKDIRDIRAELRTANGKLDQVILLLTQKQGE